MQKLSHLPVLKSVTFNDVHFGACPVCRVEGYRAFVIAALPHLNLLDNRFVAPEARLEANKHFLQEVSGEEHQRALLCSYHCIQYCLFLPCFFGLCQAMNFSRRIDAYAKDHDAEMLSLESRRRKNADNGE